jgi:predicted acyltransferase
VKVAAHHIESLDVFRGITIAAMILVNNPGEWTAVFPQLFHAAWTGCTAADLVFPWFIFIMGFAMPFAFARRHGQGDERARVAGRIGRRVVLLIAIGVCLNAVAAWPSAAPVRFPGVLQRIALSYAIAAAVVLYLNVSEWMIAAAVLLIGHWALLALVPFGGYQGGTLTPEHNLARYVDTVVFGRHALAIPNDPEGLLGTLSAAATALIGALAADLVRRARNDAERLRKLAIVGALVLAAGLAWSRVLPLSKPLWTGSFVFVVSGLAMLVFAAIYAIVDVGRLSSWSRPFLWLGVNPLAIYVLSEIVGHALDGVWVRQAGGRTSPKAWLFWRVLQPAMRPAATEWASLAFGLAFAALWMAVAGVLYQRRIRIQV